MNDDFEIVGDEAREARVVAVVLGEASDFEREEVARLCEESPELQVFRRRMEAVHGLIGESRVQNPESRPNTWKLSKSRRDEVLAKLGEKETVVAGPKRKVRFLGLNPWQHASLIAAACLVVVAGRLVWSTGGMKEAGPILAVNEEVLENQASLSSPAPVSPSVARAAKERPSLATERLMAEKAVPAADAFAVEADAPLSARKPILAPIAAAQEPMESSSLAARGSNDVPVAGTTWAMKQEVPEALAEAEVAISDFDAGLLPPLEGQAKVRSLALGDVAGSDEDLGGVVVSENAKADAFASDEGLGGGALVPRPVTEKSLAGARVVGRTEGQPLLEQRFKVPSTFLSDLAPEDISDDADAFASERGVEAISESKSVKDLLSDAGVYFSEGATATFDPSSGELIVRNTADNIGLVDQISEHLGASPKSDQETAKLGYDSSAERDFGFFSNADESTASAASANDASQFGRVARGDGAFYSFGDSDEFGWLGSESIAGEGSSQEEGDLLGEERFRRSAVLGEATRGVDDLAVDASVQVEAEKSMEYFDDPIRTNPSVTAEHSQKVDEVRRLLFKGEGHYNLNDFDESEKAFHQVLRIDPDNEAARRWLERSAAIKSDYYRAALDQAQAGGQLLMEVDKAWELTVPAEGSEAGEPSHSPGRRLPGETTVQTRTNARVNIDNQIAALEGALAEVKAADETGLMATVAGIDGEGVQKEELEKELQKQITDLKAQAGGADPFASESAASAGQAGQAGQASITSKLQNIIIPRIDFENTPLDEAMEYLSQKTMELDPDFQTKRRGVSFVVETGAKENGEDLGGGSLLLGSDPNAKVIDRLQLENVPLATALEYITSKTGLRYRVDEDGVTLLAIGSASSADLVTRTWKISPEEYKLLMAEAEVPEFQEDDPFVDEDSVVEEPEWSSSEKEALSNSGVDFPDGASVRYSEESGVLLVRNTLSNLDLVDQIAEALKEEVEVAQETLTMDEKDARIDEDSTFSLNVSDVSFKLAKAALEQGKWPETVRVEEFVNAFSYGERALAPNERVGVAMEQAAHPFLSQRNLLRVALQTAATGRGAGVPLRLTVVLDKSGSMERLDRAAAVDEAFRVLVDQLNPGDRVTLVGFSRTPTLLADFVDGAEGERLLKILRETPSEGGTNVEEALKLAQAKALEHFQEGAQNRVILLTDGIANLGEEVPEQLMTLVEGMREEGVAFDACGVGVEGLNDDILEALTRKGDGRYYLLGSTEESGADFAKQVAGALRPAAQNVKVQLEWNAGRVGKWRLYGFEKHELKKEDFRNDAVDAAEMAAEEEGVALYHVEVKPDGEGPLGVARVRFLDVANNEMVEREWVIPYEGEAPALSEANEKIRLAGLAGLVAEKLARSAVGERAEWDELLERTRQLKTVFPKEERVKDLERMIEQAKGLE